MCFFMRRFVPVTGLLLLMMCAQEPVNQVEETILATVGGKTISLEEFKYRAEFIPRPPMFKDKHITLNNLIAEKLVSMDAGEKNELAQNENFQAYIQGIQEQAMREQLFYVEAQNKASTDTSEIHRVYDASRYEYKVAFYSIYNDETAQRLTEELSADSVSRAEVFDAIGENMDVPVHDVKFKDPDHDAIHDALYSRPLEVGEVLGPVQLDKNHHIVMKIQDWTFHPVIGPEDQQMRIKEVETKILEKKANQLWHAYTGRVMEGKKLEFDNETFLKMADISFSLFQNSQQDKEIDQNQDNAELLVEDLRNDSALLDYPFFNIDNEVWTVRDFKKALASHPLVYRNKQFQNKKHYFDEFKKAIADMIKDHYLNQEAYDRHLDRHNTVKRRVSMWKDASIAHFQVENHIRSVTKRPDFDKTKMKGSDNYLVQYVDSLAAVYGEKITINQELLDGVGLTNADMMALQQHVPYPVVVPSFPQYVVKKKLGMSRQ